MVEIYAANIQKYTPEDIFAAYIAMVSPERADKIRRFHFKQDGIRSLLGEVIIRKWYSQKMNIQNERISIHKNAYGKPYIEGSPFYYNISHSGDWVVCGIGDHEIGVDVEEIKPMDFSVAEHCFTWNELNILNQKSGQEKLNFFYSVWTLKEAYIKFLGKGLNVPLKSFYFQFSEDEIQLIDSQVKTRPFFQQSFLDANHICSVCFPQHPFSIQFINI